jgi:capsular exopolysaccharide synthesis family protein
MTDNTALVRLRELEREAAAAQGVYESYLRRLQEVASQDRLTSTDARLVSAAVAPRSPFSPNFRAAFALALVLGLVLGAGAGVLVELIDHRIGSADNLEEKVGVPAIATIPVLSKRHLRLLPPEDQNPAGFIVEKPMSGFAEAFRVLRTYVHYSNLDARNRAIAVTSSAPNEGKTTSVMCLARIAAASGDKVVVVDCDLRRRSLNRALDIEPRAGLLQVLAGEKAWRDVLVEDRHTSVAFLPLADAVFTSRDVFGSDAMRQLVAELKDEYDLVLFDCAPILAVAETRVIAELADAVIIVARWDKTAIGALRASIHSAKSVGSNVLGIALNYVNPDAPGRSTYNEALYYYKANQSYYAT